MWAYVLFLKFEYSCINENKKAHETVFEFPQVTFRFVNALHFTFRSQTTLMPS